MSSWRLSGGSTCCDMTIRNRITELRHVRAGDLKANPKNWRKHPGYVDAAVKRWEAYTGEKGVRDGS